jgi:alcohol dehydrogenase
VNAPTSVLVHRDGRAELDQVDVGAPAAGEVVVRPTLVALNGSDLRVLTDATALRDLRQGVVLGAEAVGVVHEVGSDVTDLAVGDRVSIDPSGRCGRCVACFAATGSPCLTEGRLGWTRHGTFTTRARVPADACHPIPDGVSDGRAIWAGTIAHGIRALRRATPRVGDDVAVFGADATGIAITALAGEVGVRRVVIVDPIAARRDAARALGADVVDPLADDPVDAMRRGLGVAPDVVFVTLERRVPAASAYLVQAFEAMRIAGTVVVVGTDGRQGFDRLVDGRLATPLSKEARIRFVGPVTAAEPLSGGRPRGDWAHALERLATGLACLDAVPATEHAWSSMASPRAVDDIFEEALAQPTPLVVRMDVP